MRDILARLRATNRFSYVSFWILVILYASAFLADLIAPYPYEMQNRDYPLCPPARLRFIDSRGQFHVRPFVYRMSLVNPSLNTYEVDTADRYPLSFFTRGPRRELFGCISSTRYLFSVRKPGNFFLLGTDNHGRDVFSRLLHGARVSLSIGLVGVGISFVLGLLIGGISGYAGGKTDTVLMRVVELFMLFPAFYLMLALRAAFPIHLSSLQVYLLIVVILSLIGWASLARIIRGMVLSLKEEQYVLAARALGLSTFRIITRHILPNTFSYTVTALTLSIPGYILG